MKNNIEKRESPRCFTCRKKVGLLAFKCKCELLFCRNHRQPESHSCKFDFAKAEKKRLAKAIPDDIRRLSFFVFKDDQRYNQHIKFDSIKHSYWRFPQSISLDAPGLLTGLSFRESYQAAQKAALPYYSVAVVVSGNLGEEFCHVLDTCFLSHYLSKKGASLTYLNGEGNICEDPITGMAIKKIHYFAVPCFKFDLRKICRRIDLSRDFVSLSHVKIENNLDHIYTMFIDSINGDIIAAGTEEEKFNIRRIQYILAHKIRKGEIFSQLNDSERKEEVIRWLWSSSHGSYFGLLYLVDVCLDCGISLKNLVNFIIESLCSMAYREELSLKENEAFDKILDFLTKLNEDGSRESNLLDLGIDWDSFSENELDFSLYSYSTYECYENYDYFRDVEDYPGYTVGDDLDGVLIMGGKAGRSQKKIRRRYANRKTKPRSAIQNTKRKADRLNSKHSLQKTGKLSRFLMEWKEM